MPKIGYSANGFGKAMEASVEAVDAVEADGWMKEPTCPHRCQLGAVMLLWEPECHLEHPVFAAKIKSQFPHATASQGLA